MRFNALIAGVCICWPVCSSRYMPGRHVEGEDCRTKWSRQDHTGQDILWRDSDRPCPEVDRICSLLRDCVLWWWVSQIYWCLYFILLQIFKGVIFWFELIFIQIQLKIDTWIYVCMRELYTQYYIKLCCVLKKSMPQCI